MTTLFFGVPIDWPQANSDRASVQYAQVKFAQAQSAKSQFIGLLGVSWMQLFALMRGRTA